MKSGTKYLWRVVKPILPGCMDGKDNDQDGFTDFAGGDPQCYSGNDWSERSECSDGLNNDGDDLVDSDDPGCTSADDDDESNAANVINAPTGLKVKQDTEYREP